MNWLDRLTTWLTSLRGFLLALMGVAGVVLAIYVLYDKNGKHAFNELYSRLVMPGHPTTTTPREPASGNDDAGSNDRGPGAVFSGEEEVSRGDTTVSGRARPLAPRYVDPRGRNTTNPGADPHLSPPSFPRPPPAEEPMGYRDLRTTMTGAPDLVFTPPLSRCRFEVSEVSGQCAGRWAVRIWVNPDTMATDGPHTSEISGTAPVSCPRGEAAEIPLKDRGPAVLTNVMAFFAAAFHAGPDQDAPRDVTIRLHWSCSAPGGAIDAMGGNLGAR